MKKAFWGLILCGVGLFLVPVTASAATYETYVACSGSAAAAPATVCKLGDSPGAFFESDEEVEYEVCVEFPAGDYLCAEEQEAEAGELYVNELTTDETGQYFVEWFVGGVEVGFWSFRIDAPPPPPTPPAPAPPSPAPPAVAPTVTPACLKAKAQVKTLKARVRQATQPKRKAKLRAKLRKVRANVLRFC
jgi:hypothetical protein